MFVSLIYKKRKKASSSLGFKSFTHRLRHHLHFEEHHAVFSNMARVLESGCRVFYSGNTDSELTRWLQGSVVHAE